MIRDAVLPLLRDPTLAASMRLSEWDVVIRQARNANLTARIAADLELRGILDRVPHAPRQHLIAARAVGARQKIATLAEIERVRRALSEFGLRLVLLKGAAYVAAGLPVARGRVFGDIDLLVDRNRLPDAESALMMHGWISTHLDEYDQRYYRQWMHELPPLRHMNRGSALDVHHNILPLTARHPPDAKLLLDAAIPAAESPGTWVLAPPDMVLHSACHLFHEGELDNGLRDLVDLDGLLRYFASQEGFWSTLEARAAALHLERPMRYALRMCSLMLETPVPASTLAFGGGWPADLRERLLEQLYLRGLRPNDPTAGDAWTPLARHLLYLRGHWLRMPPHLLVAHLSRKAWRSWSGRDDRDDVPAPEAIKPDKQV
ncbi:nucleotidyltransferase family protein [Niveibacterium umoris]|uniref:Nucleotidyltransferase family protein n=1 Tax=Niveibacterium umoris TaxID=1193620 RepID=A0A840BR97_9RHOO|nr:nucleotidyltransferase family protein [Niveibacterium umoris]MBB4012927.1 hypothetical protein [Niveibacterium umoris]